MPPSLSTPLAPTSAFDLEGWFSSPMVLTLALALGAILLFVLHHLRQERRLRQALREGERTARDLAQSEQLLHTLIDAAPMAIMLLEDLGNIEYANQAARELFFEGQQVQRSNFLSLLDEAPAPLRDAVLDVSDGFFTVTEAGAEETYHLAKRHFELHERVHTLLMVKRLTREVRQKEVDVWKKLIRVLSHELNNSLAPISSLMHTAQKLIGPLPSEKLTRVFETINERLVHLRNFMDGYARFARLAPPTKSHVNLGEFVRSLEILEPQVRYLPTPMGTGYFDRAQLEQVAINLLKNAREAGGDPREIELALTLERNGALTLTVSDRGSGMSEQVLSNAMLPFYSTKERGSGLGLALCREIVEAHNGQLSLENREGGGLLVSVTLPGFEHRISSNQGKLTLSRL